MEWFTVLLLAVGLAMDAFSVSICSGMLLGSGQTFYIVRMAAFFGAFQTLMPVFGWLGGNGFSHFISAFDHWIAFGLLAFIGGKMLYESLRGESCKSVDVTKLRVLCMLAIATSIDALAVGLSFAVLDVSIVVPVLVIGVVTFVLSLVGVRMGRRFGDLLQSRAATFGGLVLIGIGVKILVEHLWQVATVIA
jgi:putative Mn2+ efflux pump MntP